MLIERLFNNNAQMMKHNQVDVVVLGHNYSTSLGLIMSLGEAGYRCASVKRIGNGRMPKIRRLLAPDFCSKYVSSCQCVPANDNSSMLKTLISLYGSQDEKKVLLPSDDACAFFIDENKSELSAHFHIPWTFDDNMPLSLCMDKEVQKRCASNCGISVAKSWSVDVNKGVDPSIPSSITFPCITKPQLSKGLSKGFIQKCSNDVELHSVLKMISDSVSCKILIEEFVNVEVEYTIPGISDGTDVFISSFIKKSVVGIANHKGVTVCGKIEDGEAFVKIRERLRQLISSFHFSGIFDIEIFYSKGDFYLNEINFRIGAASYALTKAGVNMPAIYVEHLLSGTSLLRLDSRDYVEMEFVNDKAALEYYLSKGCSLFDYLKIVSGNKSHSLGDWTEPRVQLAFNFTRFSSIIKHFMKKGARK